MLRKVCFLLLLISLGNCQYGDFDDGLSSLKDLGARINSQVQRELRGLDGLGEQISNSVHQSLAPLQNLGPQIQQQVYQQLEPVRALPIMANMKNGVGGTTIAVYKPSGKSFIIANGKRSECIGSIESGGKCSGELKPFEVKSDSDYCFSENFNIVNNYICLSTGPVSVSVYNNNVQCKSSSNNSQPTKLIPIDEFKQLCKDNIEIDYTYISNPSDPVHINIPNENKYVKCDNDEVGICKFNHKLTLPSGGVFIRTSSVHVFN